MPKLDIQAYEDHVKAINDNLRTLAVLANNMSTEIEHIGRTTKNDALVAIAERLHKAASDANYAGLKLPKLSTDDDA